MSRQNQSPLRPGCPTRELHAWRLAGGPLPSRLADHAAACPACAAQVRAVSQVHAALALLSTQAAPPELTARANARALRFLRRAARATAAAHRLLRLRPTLTRYQRACIHMARMSVGAAAAMLGLLMRAGILTGFDRTRELGGKLAACHWQRQVDPDGEYLGPRSFV
jgi:hypothetical protein